MVEHFFKNRYEYLPWDGTQHIEFFDADDILQALLDDYLNDGNLQRAFRRLMMAGISGGNGPRIMGLREMLVYLRDQRSWQLNRYNMGSGPMDDLREKLEEIKRLECTSIQCHLDEKSIKKQYMLRKQSQSDQHDRDRILNELEMIVKNKQEYLEKLPKDIPAQIRGLSKSDFINDQAHEQFKELVENLRRQIFHQFFQDMQHIKLEDITRSREMICSINKMLQERQQDQESDFDAFLQEHGEYFPSINSLDDLIEQAWQQMAAKQGIFDNLWPEQRQELQILIEQFAVDEDIYADLLEMETNLEAVAAAEKIRTKFPFRGNEALPLNIATRMIRRLQRLEKLEEQLQKARHLDDLDIIDSEDIRELLGDEEYRSIVHLKALMKMLKERGYIQEEGKQWRLTTRSVRKIGQKALQDIFNKLKRNGFGQHVSHYWGTGGESTGESKPYQFGEAFQLDLKKTLMNSILHRGTGIPIVLAKDDFEVYRTELTTQSSTVLMIDMSLSMLYNGCQLAAKKIAVALESLTHSQFPRDNLYIVGFSFVAREYRPDELIEMSRYDNDRGTNMVHGLMLARQLLARHRGVNKQIIMITDGAPTIWYEEAVGGWQFAYPSPYAEQQTLLEAQRCTRDGITINTFMLYDDEWMVAFVNQMTEVNHGRTFYVDKDNLEEYILVDYLNSKQKFTQ